MRTISFRRMAAAGLLLLIPIAMVAFAQQGAGVGRDLLNSERIEARFGSYGVDVLESDERLRISNLFSIHDGRRICRTFAVVLYPAEPEPAYEAEHALIAAGGSIGATFVANGWRVEKRHRYFGSIPKGERVDRLMGQPRSAHLAVHVYALDIVKQGRRFEYAVIAEVHHPEYLGLDDIERIYGTGLEPPRQAGGEVAELLNLVLERGAASASALLE